MKYDEAIRILGNVSLDYTGMNQEEIDQMDEALTLAFEALKASSWIPIKTRDMTDEEFKVFEEYCYPYKPTRDEGWCFDCPLPDHKQEVLVSTPWGIRLTEFYFNDDDYTTGFEDYDERNDVLAWMSLPEPYKKEEDHD